MTPNTRQQLTRVLITLLALGSLTVGIYLIYRWWQNQPATTELPTTHRILPDNAAATEQLFKCPPGNQDCPQRLEAIGPGEIKVLGNPAANRYPKPEQWPARTPWDLMTHERRLYIGLGDASNDGLTPNAGPVPVLAYDPATRQLTEEAILPEEEINRFHSIDNQLMIPGTDSRQSWDWGNLYVLQKNGSWQQRRTIPGFIHVLGLTPYNDLLFAGGNIAESVAEGLGSQRHGSAVAVSNDQGNTWHRTPLGGWRITDFLTVNNTLFATDAFSGPGLQAWLNAQGRQNYYSPIYELKDGGTWGRRPDLNANVMLPATALAGKRMALIEHSIQWKSASLYIASFVYKLKEQPVRAGYIARNLKAGQVDVTRLPFNDLTQVWDLVINEDGLWVATAAPLSTGRWLNQLHHSNDAKNWHIVQGFEAPSYAVSVALDSKSVYWGLGGEMYAGTLLSISR